MSKFEKLEATIRAGLRETISTQGERVNPTHLIFLRALTEMQETQDNIVGDLKVLRGRHGWSTSADCSYRVGMINESIDKVIVNWGR